MVLIRPGEPRDLAEIGAIQAACPEAARWPVADYLAYNLSVAVCQHSLAAFLVARPLVAGECEILNLAVAPEIRRQGLATALLEAFLRGFKGAVFLEVRSSNAGALAFYKAFGFQELAVRQGYYSSPPEAAIVMKFHSC